MSKICCLLGAGEPRYASAKSLSRAFRELGHDLITVGPGYFDRYEADILLPDKAHVEYYSYSEVLERLPWSPDLLVNIDPHAFCSGEKPAGLCSVFVATDAHRAGELYHRVLEQGSYDWFFCAPPYFLPLFQDIPHLKVRFLSVGFDTERFSFTEIPPECDCSFVGQTGIANLEYDEEDEIGRYTTHPPFSVPQSPEKYTFGPPSYDYATRAEFLIRLMRHFNVRIYEPLYDERYQHAIQKGAVGFNCSVLHDIPLRIFEVCAAGRLLITDRVPGIEDLLQDKIDCRYYDVHYLPFYKNFDLDYAQVYNLFRYYLDHDREREDIARNARAEVWAKHTWAKRAQRILDYIG